MYIGGGVTKILHSTSDSRSGREGKHTARRVGQGSLAWILERRDTLQRRVCHTACDLSLAQCGLPWHWPLPWGSCSSLCSTFRSCSCINCFLWAPRFKSQSWASPKNPSLWQPPPPRCLEKPLRWRASLGEPGESLWGEAVPFPGNTLGFLNFGLHLSF